MKNVGNKVLIIIILFSLLSVIFVKPSNANFNVEVSESASEVIYPIMDTYITDAMPDTDHGSLSKLKLGVNNSYKYYILLGFDFADYFSILDLKITIERAVPNQYFNLIPVFITEPWNESVTWVNQPKVEPSIGNGNELVVQNCGAAVTSCSVQISDIGFLFPNYGILLWDPSEGLETFSSRENSNPITSIYIEIGYVSKKTPPVKDSSIRIENDSGFDLYGFPGTGTTNDPYKIDGYEINTIKNIGISISDTTKNFIIQYNTITARDYGILINNIKSGTGKIFSNSISNVNLDGIHVSYSDSFIISQNSITSFGSDALFVGDSSNSVIELNSIIGNGTHGISGIHLFQSNWSSISNNTVTTIKHAGIYIVESENIQIKFNTNNFGTYGIYGEALKLSNIEENLLDENNFYGVNLDNNSTNNKIFGNNFNNNQKNALNAKSQAFDDGQGNTWYNELTSMGNYWTDWVSGKYAIDGVGNAFDIYPEGPQETKTISTISLPLLESMSSFFVLVLITRKSRRE